MLQPEHFPPQPLHWAPPFSGKPADLKLSELLTINDCNAALVWLQTVLLDMERQVSDRGLDDREWLKKLRAAERATTNLRHMILSKRDGFTGVASLTQAVAQVALDLLGAQHMDALEAAVAARYPHLAGFDLAGVISAAEAA